MICTSLKVGTMKMASALGRFGHPWYIACMYVCKLYLTENTQLQCLSIAIETWQTVSY